MLPSIFGEDLFDDWMNDYFPFGRILTRLNVSEKRKMLCMVSMQRT